MSNQDLTINIRATLDGVEDAIKTVQDLFKKGSEAAKAMSGTVGGDVSDSLKLVTADCAVLGPALETAFSPLAILSFATALADAADKLSRFISDTFIYTDAQKQSYEEVVKANKATADHLLVIEKLNDAYQRMGKTASQQVELDIEATEQQLALKKAEVDAQWLQKTYYAETNEDEKKAADAYGRAKENVQELQAALRNLQQQRALLLNEEMKPAVEAEILGWQKVQEARIDLEKSTTSGIQSLVRTTAAEREATETQFENQLYQIKLTGLSRRLQLEKLDPDKNIAQIVSLQRQIEALVLEHRAKLSQIHAQGIAEQRKQEDDQFRAVQEENKRETAEILKDAKARNDAIIAKGKELLDAQAALYKGDMDAAKVDEQTKVQLAEAALARGKITKQHEIAIIAAAKQQEIQLEIQAEKAIEALYDNEPKKVAEIEAKIRQLRAQAALAEATAANQQAKANESRWQKQLQDWQNISKEMQDSYLQMLNSMNSALVNFVTTGKFNWQQMANSMIGDILKIALQWVESQIMMKVMGASTAKTNATAGIGASAAQGAAAAGASVAAIPVIGWSMVEAVSSSTYAMLEAYQAGIAGFALGGIVPATGLAMVHQGETILPASMSGTGAGLKGGGSPVHVHFHINAIDGADAAAFIQKNANNITSVLYKQMRKKGIQVG